jgi:glycosyltransferase 2 family protein
LRSDRTEVISRRRIAQAGGLLILVVSIGFLATRLQGLGASVRREGISRSDVWRLIGAFVLYLGGLIGVHVAWALLVSERSVDGGRNLLRAFAVSCRAHIAKYLPGNVFHLAGRHVLVSRLEWPQASAAGATLIELFVLPLVALTVVAAAGLLGADHGVNDLEFGIPPELLVAAAIVVLVAGAAAALLSKWAVAFRTHLRSWRGLMVPVVALYLLFFLATGVAQSLTLPGQPIGAVVAAASAAWVVGYLTPGAPGGVGVREAVFVLMLDLDNRAVVMGVLGFRIAMIAADAVLFGLGSAVERRYRRSAPVSTPAM